ncbi:FAD-dependent oxidoreductase [Microbacterium halophytorum]|uniref:FAD-dependent oxidoreductase n=1 Tax=Microbacterium halophytorum TaxID=2067568 RepID=UPI000CFD53C2|nr:FAD-dependent oxidoreductase [Microbacterium halophytorum]
MQHRTQQYDIVVIGGGLAGVTAAVSAARLGSHVALVTNRPVLGGNSSSEVRVWVVGATAHGTQRFARETGLMGELFLENQYRNPEGNPHYWDQVVLDAVRAEPGVSLFLNTDVREIEMGGPSNDGPLIRSVTGWTMGSEITTRFEAPVFIDCTGDGTVAHLAGAASRIGREARSEYDEPWAPEVADRELLGSSMFFYTKDAGRPVPFVPPLIAKDILKTSIPRNRIIRTGDNGCDYWWIEWGGEIDTVHDNERIRDELWAVVFGIWDHIKNSGDFDADNLTLEWVGSVPGKREYRRLWGDYTLTQHDIVNQTPFDDAVAFGGWSIDLHPVEGVYAESVGAKQHYSDGTYAIPYRSLYSRDVGNLLFAGRNISASHVAFGSTRVMATCATQGQAVGTAASIAAARGVSPRAVGRDRLDELQCTLLREDAPVIGVRRSDPDDVARLAAVTATSTLGSVTTRPHATGDAFALDRDVAVLVPADPGIDAITFDVRASSDTRLGVELWHTGRGQNAVPVRRLASTTVELAAGATLASAAFSWRPDDEIAQAVVVVRANPHVGLVLTDERPYGVLAMGRKLTSDQAFDDQIPEAERQPVTDWNARMLRRRSFALQVEPATRAYDPSSVTDGVLRPFGGPHLWSSEPVSADELLAAPQGVDLEWEAPVALSSVRLVWNDDVDEDLINLHHHRTPFRTMPELPADYVVEARVDGTWRNLASVTDNRHRHRIHDFAAVEADALRIRVSRTNGSPYVTLCAVRAFGEPSGRSVTMPWR